MRAYIRELAEKVQPNGNTTPIGIVLSGISMLLEQRTDIFDDVADFHRKFGIQYDGPSRALPADLQEFRNNTIKEELDEYLDAQAYYKQAVAEGDVKQQAMEVAAMMDALLDLIYFASGTLQLHGFKHPQEAWRRIHSANMSKELASEKNPSKRGGEGFDIVKPAGWVAPDLSDLVADYVPVIPEPKV